MKRRAWLVLLLVVLAWAGARVFMDPYVPPAPLRTSPWQTSCRPSTAPAPQPCPFTTSAASLASDFGVAFEPRTLPIGAGKFAKVECVAMAPLTLPSGRIRVTDPIFLNEWNPLPAAVPPGVYPGWLSRAVIGPNHTREAAVLVQFSAERPVRWQATSKDNFFPVDTGTAVVIDDALAARLTPNDAFGDDYSGPPGWSDLCVDRTRGHNALAMRTGWGDGAYPTYWGQSEQGKTVALLIWFEVFDREAPQH